MKQSVEFFPLDRAFKCPQGAAVVDEENRFSLKFTRPSNPEDVYLCLTKDGEDKVFYPMSFISIDSEGKYTYECRLRVTSVGLYFYHFLVNTKDESIHIGCDDSLNAMFKKGQDWQLTVFKEKQDLAWYCGGVMYQILVDRFNKDGEQLRTKPHAIYREDWGGLPNYKPDAHGKILNNDFFGGNLKGITKKLSYLKSLGVNCIYLNPIFEARSNHKYDTGNYRKIDPDFGTFYDFLELVKKADKNGMKLMLDGVFSHTGDDSIYFNKYGTYDSVGAYQSEKSPYAGWYTFNDFENKKYECWWNIDTLPNTNECNPQFEEFINGEDGIIRYWTEAGVYGWRLDVADELPDSFLDRLSRTVKKANPKAIVLGEVWEDASNKVAYSYRRRYLQGGQLDSVTNYPLKEAIISFVRNGNTQGLVHIINVLINNYPSHVLHSLMNILGTHDTARILSVLGDSGATHTREQRANAKLLNLNEATAKLKLATLMQFTLMGVPCVYYGDEIGQEGFEDPFNRRCFDYENKNPAILKWYKRLGAIRKEHKSIFADGNLNIIESSNGIFAFSREKDGQELIVIINNSSEPYTFQAKEGSSYTELTQKKPFQGTIPKQTGVVLKKN